MITLDPTALQSAFAIACIFAAMLAVTCIVASLRERDRE